MGRHKRSRRLTVCARCQSMKFHEAHGLCKCCYNHVREGRAGCESLDDYRGSSVTRWEPIDRATGLRKHGLFDPLSKLAAGPGLNLVAGRRMKDDPHQLSKAELLAQQITALPVDELADAAHVRLGERNAS